MAPKSAQRTPETFNTRLEAGAARPGTPARPGTARTMLRAARFAKRVAPKLAIASCLGVLAVTGCGLAHESGELGSNTEALIDMKAEPTAEWDAGQEKGFANFVYAIGLGNETKKCILLSACLNDSSVNPLKSATDEPIGDLPYADCADVALQLRGYYAVKKGLPFQYVSSINWAKPGPPGAEAQYADGVTPAGLRASTSFNSMTDMLRVIADEYHTGMYRMEGNVEGADTYTVDVNRDSVVPGTAYSDPNGHVLIVWKVDADGTVRLLQGHPPNFLDTTVLSTANAIGRPGGGFRAWRTLKFAKGATPGTGSYSRVPNASMPNWSATAQYGHNEAYYDWVRDRLATVATPPAVRFKSLAENVCRAAQTRVASVAAGAPYANGPMGPLPPNIYGASGDWENWATPGGDAKLRKLFSEAAAFARKAAAANPANLAAFGWTGTRAALGAALKQAWAETASQCGVVYRNSAGADVKLTLLDIESRLFDLSFDLYHCPEMRWGAFHSATAQTPDMATCTSSPERIQRFDEERGGRNAINREIPGPELPPTGVTVTEALKGF